ncbi:MAG: hypothetical protein NVS3B20_04950 [Polyangiales bacterium]
MQVRYFFATLTLTACSSCATAPAPASKEAPTAAETPTERPEGTAGAGANAIKTIAMGEAGTEVEGELPKEVIKRIVHANFPRLRACYEVGLRNDPSVAGTIATRFVIGEKGTVETRSLASSTFKSPTGVPDCVLHVFETMTFPEPEKGKVIVTYPIQFSSEPKRI